MRKKKMKRRLMIVTIDGIINQLVFGFFFLGDFVVGCSAVPRLVAASKSAKIVCSKDSQ